MMINSSNNPLRMSSPHPKFLPNPQYDFEIVNTSPFDMQGRSNITIYTNLNELVLENIPAYGGSFVVQYVDNGYITSDGRPFNTGCNVTFASNDRGLPQDNFDEAVDDQDNEVWRIQHRSSMEVFTVVKDFGGAEYCLIFPKSHTYREHTFNRGGLSVPTFSKTTFTSSLNDSDVHGMHVVLTFDPAGLTSAPSVALPDPVTHDQFVQVVARQNDPVGVAITGAETGTEILLPGEYVTYRSVESSLNSGTYDWYVVARVNKTPMLYQLRSGGRIYLEINNRWITVNDDNYGSYSFNQAENAGTGVDPIYEWENIGDAVAEGDTISKLMIQGRAPDLNAIEDVEIMAVFVRPSAGNSYVDGIDADAEIDETVLWRGTWMVGGSGQDPFPGDIGSRRRRTIDLNFVAPADGEYRLYFKPIRVEGSTAARDYFLYESVTDILRPVT